MELACSMTPPPASTSVWAPSGRGNLMRDKASWCSCSTPSSKTLCVRPGVNGANVLSASSDAQFKYDNGVPRFGGHQCSTRLSTHDKTIQ
jgi:hypothetical protein